MMKFCFSGNVFYPIGRFVASGTNLLAHQVVKQMEGISELLPEEDVQKLKSVPKRLPLQEREMVRELKEFGVKALSDQDGKVDCVIVTVAHDEFRAMGLSGYDAVHGNG